MAPNEISDPDVKPRKLHPIAPEDEIVISGIAGRFPESNNLSELHENLINKKDLITDDDRRWSLEHPEIPKRTGKLYNIEKFDSTFFGVHFKQAHIMDPCCRMLLEHTYEAVIDAGVNPRQLKGTKTGVFIGASFCESEKTWFYEKLQIGGFGIIGCARAMLSNRISYFLGTTGPSYTVDTACSSSLYAMEHAYRAMREGLCDAAIVGGANLCLHPYVSMQFFKLGVLSTDGRCKSFDEGAGGYVRAEAISVIFLQKSKDAKRVYATVVHGKINCDGFKEEGVTFPSTHMQTVLMKEFYLECGLPPTILNYMEAHGTGTRVGDPEELNAIDRVFCAGRKKPLMIGSVKSNLGHSEPASGLVSVSKVVLAMEKGVIQPNLHYTGKTPRDGVPALRNGKLKVITEPTPWEGGYVGVNSFGFGGANAHILLKSNPKKKVNNGAPNDNLQRLVVVSGRNEDAVDTILKDLESKPVDVEYVRLLHDIHSEDINGHLCRGYTLLPAHGVADKPIREIQNVPGAKRPIWFVFAGMGSQWPGMGEALLRIPIFYEAIKKCDAILKPLGVDIFHVITNKEKTAFDNILNSFVGITAVQIGLVDIIKALGIVPDMIIGHSLGELGCAYADGSFTVEQMIMAAYSRGLISLETKIEYGCMAAVGLGYNELKDIVPPQVDIACHNSIENCTISGPAEPMKAFIAELQAKNIFAKEVPCGNIPYHSRYIAVAGPKFLAYLKKFVPNPKPRSSKWLSTSVPMDKWDSPIARYSSAEYHTNNLLNPVLFEEVTAFIPKDAITIEIAPHGLLQAILRRALHPNVTNIPLTKRGHQDNSEFLLQALGKLFNVGLHFQLANIYPHVQYPVSCSTPMISPLIKWEHSDDWYVTSYDLQQKVSSSERIVKISLSEADFEPMAGHVIDGRILFPATGYLTLVWETMSMMLGKLYTEVPVVFENVKFIRATTIPKDREMEFTIVIQKGSGSFEIIEGGAVVVSGEIRVCTNPDSEKVEIQKPTGNEEEILKPRDVYKELRLRGYHYNGIFRSIKSMTTDALKGHISWYNNWVAFMDNLLQVLILREDTRGLFVPTSIKKIVIDPKTHLSGFKFGELQKDFPVYIDKILDIIESGGVQLHGLEASAIPRRKPAGDPVLEEYKFVSYMDRIDMNLQEIARIVTHISLENCLGVKVKTIELVEKSDQISSKDLLSPWFSEALEDIPLIQPDVGVYSLTKFEDGSLPSNISVMDPKKITADANAILVSGHHLLSTNRADNLTTLLQALKVGGFLLTREDLKTIKNLEETTRNQGLDIVLEKKCGNEVFILLKKHDKQVKINSVISINNQKFDWIEKMRQILSKEIERKSDKSRILFIGQGDYDNGLMGFINCLRQEPGGEMVRGLLIQDPKAPEFSLQNPFYLKQLQKDLAINVLRASGDWGSYRHLPLSPPEYKSVRQGWVNQLVRGDLSSLSWLEGPIQVDDKNKNLVNVAYSSINFKDVMLASGKLAAESVVKTRQAQECVIGLEFSGINSEGKRVMGLVESRGMTNLCLANPELVWEIPEKWTLEDAATIPCVYATCYYALYECGRMKKGDKVLIHAGTGGVGQAAINLAIHEGCEIFTTVGTPEKRRFIREHFPQIKEDHIGNSRDTSFEQMIKRQTNGRGVDIVLNSLAEEKLQASVACLAWGGRFLEIGKFDLTANNPLGLRAFLSEVSFKGVMLDAVITEASNERRIAIKKIVAEGLKNGAIKPLIRTVFPKNEVEAAFRYMASGKHMGKVIIKVREDNERLDGPISALPRFYCLPNRSYIILGGLGGFGLELADWLVLRGAKNLILTSRAGLKNGYQHLRVKLWESYGVRVVVIARKDPSKQEECQSIIESAAKIAPVDGIFNLAVVLKDALWENQTAESFEESFRSKAWATKHLDAISRKMCPTLRYFVVFSSVSSGRGNAGQTNYGMSNSVMERICERRSSEGLPGLAIQWGAIGDVGIVADMQENNKELVIGGTLQQRISSCLHELDGFLRQNKPIVGSMVVAEKKAGGSGTLSLVETVLNIMGLKDLKGISPYASLAEIGMDSMMSVEIKQTLEREFEVYLTAQDIRVLNFAKLQELAAGDNNNAQDSSKSNVSPIEDSQENAKLVMRILGPGDLSSETYMKLRTREEAGLGEVFVIPGTEGLGSVYSKIALNIRAPATCLQLGITTNHHKSIFEISDYFLPHVLKKCKSQGHFVIAGHSFGTAIAVELVRRLEAEGLNGRLILVDGSPYQLKAMVKQYLLPYNNEDEFQNSSILGVINVICPENVSKAATDLAKCKTWDEKTEIFIKYCPDSKLNLSVENKKALCVVYYTRYAMLLKYDVSQLKPLKTPITLIKPTLRSVNYDAEDYDLSKVTTGKVEVHYAKGSHLSLLDDEIVAQAINGDSLIDDKKFKSQILEN